MTLPRSSQFRFVIAAAVCAVACLVVQQPAVAQPSVVTAATIEAAAIASISPPPPQTTFGAAAALFPQVAADVIAAEAAQQAAAAESARAQAVTAEAFMASGTSTQAEAYTRNLTLEKASDLASAVLFTERASILDLSLEFVPPLPQEPPSPPLGPPPPMPAAGGVEASPALCGNGVCDDGEDCSSCAQDCSKRDSTPCQRVGILYSVWHWPAWNAVELTKKKGKPVYSVEDILRTRTEDADGKTGGKSFRDIIFGNGLAGEAMLFHWQHTPVGGPYCIYHQRQPGDVNYNHTHEGGYQVYTNQPDCPEYQATLRRHAAQLVAAGIDHVLVDMTNLDKYSATSDAIQLRPFEVLVEEWALLRRQGVQTPDIAAWQRVPLAPVTLATTLNTSALMYPYVMAVYNQPEYDRMFLRDRATGRKIFVYPVFPGIDDAFPTNIQSNGDRNDLITVPMWVNGQKTGEWAFMAFCAAPGFITDAPCNQPMTQKTQGIGGSQLAVSPSYQISWGSTPWNSAGLWGGLTLRKQFSKALEMQPDWLFISSWNEYIAQPTVAPLKSMGLETDTTVSNLGFVDQYGAGFGRDIEPDTHNGDFLYRLMSSCLRVWRSGAKACTSTTEMCCYGGNFSSKYQYYSNGKDATFGMYAVAAGPGRQGRLPLYHCSGPPVGATWTSTGRRSRQPTAVPTRALTAAPTAVPTAAPTAMPTAAPTDAPTVAPTAPPTDTPTEASQQQSAAGTSDIGGFGGGSSAGISVGGRRGSTPLFDPTGVPTSTPVPTTSTPVPTAQPAAATQPVKPSPASAAPTPPSRASGKATPSPELSPAAPTAQPYTGHPISRPREETTRDTKSHATPMKTTAKAAPTNKPAKTAKSTKKHGHVSKPTRLPSSRPAHRTKKASTRKRSTVRPPGSTHVRQTTQPKRRQLLQATSVTEFLSTRADCEGRLKSPSAQLVGYISSIKGNGNLRTLRRCSNPGGGPRYSVMGACPVNAPFDGVLGYVR